MHVFSFQVKANNVLTIIITSSFAVCLLCGCRCLLVSHGSILMIIYLRPAFILPMHDTFFNNTITRINVWKVHFCIISTLLCIFVLKPPVVFGFSFLFLSCHSSVLMLWWRHNKHLAMVRKTSCFDLFWSPQALLEIILRCPWKYPVLSRCRNAVTWLASLSRVTPQPSPSLPYMNVR